VSLPAVAVGIVIEPGVQAAPVPPLPAGQTAPMPPDGPVQFDPLQHRGAPPCCGVHVDPGAHCPRESQRQPWLPTMQVAATPPPGPPLLPPLVPLLLPLLPPFPPPRSPELPSELPPPHAASEIPTTPAMPATHVNERVRMECLF
jgi:hypothetical protein